MTKEQIKKILEIDQGIRKARVHMDEEQFAEYLAKFLATVAAAGIQDTAKRIIEKMDIHRRDVEHGLRYERNLVPLAEWIAKTFNVEVPE